MLLSHAMREWLRVKESTVKHTTYDMLEGMSDRFLRRIGDCEVDSLTLEQLQAYVDRRAKSCAPSTVAQERGILRWFFTWCVERGAVEKNPAARLKSRKVPKTVPQIPTELEFLTIMRRIKNPVAAVAAGLAAETGLRRRTLLELQWKDIQGLYEEVSWLNIPGEKQKSGRTLRVPLSANAKEILRSLGKKSYLSEEGLVLQIPKSTLGAAWREARGSLPYRFHDLRKLFISRCRRRGVPIEVVQRLSDHADLRTCLEVYRHVGNDELVNAMESFNATDRG